MDLLGSMSCLSDIGHQLLATTMVLNTDLEVIAMDTEQEDVCKKSLVQYLKAQTIILKQVFSAVYYFNISLTPGFKLVMSLASCRVAYGADI